MLQIVRAGRMYATDFASWTQHLKNTQCLGRKIAKYAPSLTQVCAGSQRAKTGKLPPILVYQKLEFT